MSKVFNKVNGVTCLFLLLWIAVGEYVLHFLHLPTWPVFTGMVAFFLVESKKEEIPKIVVGASVGIIFFYILAFFYVKLFPATLLFHMQVFYVLVFVGLIVLLRGVAPLFFNSFAFLYFLVANMGLRTDPATLEHSVFANSPIILPWLVLVLVGCTVILLGCVMIGKWTAQICGIQPE